MNRCDYPPGFTIPSYSSTLIWTQSAYSKPSPDKSPTHIRTPKLSQSPCVNLNYHPVYYTELDKDKHVSSISILPFPNPTAQSSPTP